MPKAHSAPSSKAVTCSVCGIHIGRVYDLPRHMKRHADNKDEISFHCEILGCGYKTLQKDNLKIHMRIHFGIKDRQCPDCPYNTGDPSSLYRHRVRKHQYVPKRRSSPNEKAEIECAYPVPVPKAASPPDEFTSSMDLLSNATTKVVPYFTMPDTLQPIVPPQAIPAFRAQHQLSLPVANDLGFDGLPTWNPFPNFNVPALPNLGLFSTDPLSGSNSCGYHGTIDNQLSALPQYHKIWSAHSLLQAASSSFQPTIDIPTPSAELQHQFGQLPSPQLVFDPSGISDLIPILPSPNAYPCEAAQSTNMPPTLGGLEDFGFPDSWPDNDLNVHAPPFTFPSYQETDPIFNGLFPLF